MSSLAPHHDTIAQMRMAGKTAQQIADEIGATRGAVSSYAHRHALPKRETARPECVLPYGTLAIGRDLTPQQIKALEGEAVNMGCESLAEAALEHLRDVLDERAATR